MQAQKNLAASNIKSYIEGSTLNITYSLSVNAEDNGSICYCTSSAESC